MKLLLLFFYADYIKICLKPSYNYQNWNLDDKLYCFLKYLKQQSLYIIKKNVLLKLCDHWLLKNKRYINADKKKIKTRLFFEYFSPDGDDSMCWKIC